MPAVAPLIEPRAEYALVARMLDGRLGRLAGSIEYGAALARWSELDRARTSGHLPHVAWLAVRPLDDPFLAPAGLPLIELARADAPVITAPLARATPPRRRPMAPPMPMLRLDDGRIVTYARYGIGTTDRSIESWPARARAGHTCRGAFGYPRRHAAHCSTTIEVGEIHIALYEEFRGPYGRLCLACAREFRSDIVFGLDPTIRVGTLPAA